MTRRDRPDALGGSTQRINTGLGKMYVTINVDEDEKPFEIFINIGSSGNLVNGFTEALAKSISNALRTAEDQEMMFRVIAEDLMGIRYDRVDYDNDDEIKSVPDGVGIAMMRFIEDKFEEPIRGDAPNGAPTGRAQESDDHEPET